MHAGVSVGVGELQKIVRIEVGDFLFEPEILKPVQIVIELKMLPRLGERYLFNSACNFSEK